MTPDSQREAAHREDLAEAIGRAILGERADAELEAPDHLRLVGRAADAERVSRRLLQESVSAARSHGVSWAALGAELGLSRQAMQQRFGSPAATAPEDGDAGEGADERWLGPVTVFEELRELEAAGRLGWRTVELGFLRHRMVRTDTQWEHKRVLWSAVPRSEAEGWSVAHRAFPWVYLVRDTGLPVAES